MVCYFRDISTHVAARKALQEQQRELEAADQQKNEFLAMLAHELRNPLAPIRNSGEVLARSADRRPTGRQGGGEYRTAGDPSGATGG